MSNGVGPVFRVDKFVVPEAGLEEFRTNVQRTHQLLVGQPGFRYDLVLEKTSGTGTFNIVTLAAWESDQALADARTAVDEQNRRIDFSPQELMERLGVTGDMANYSEIRDR